MKQKGQYGIYANDEVTFCPNPSIGRWATIKGSFSFWHFSLPMIFTKPIFSFACGDSSSKLPLVHHNFSTCANLASLLKSLQNPTDVLTYTQFLVTQFYLCFCYDHPNFQHKLICLLEAMTPTHEDYFIVIYIVNFFETMLTFCALSRSNFF